MLTKYLIEKAPLDCGDFLSSPESGMLSWGCEGSLLTPLAFKQGRTRWVTGFSAILGPLADLRPSGPTRGLGTGRQKGQGPVAELALGPGFGIASAQLLSIPRPLSILFKH